ncbi:hypothetical protein SH139x_000761 [Planctomycetaceae bacterium SH139]
MVLTKYSTALQRGSHASLGRASWLLHFMCLCCLLLCGCGGYDAKDHRVDVVLAKQTIQRVLESWQAGQEPDELRRQDPEIVVQDLDWAGGKTLQSYQLLNEGVAIDANFECEVMLQLVDGQGKSQSRQVTYLVTTSPKLTCFRKLNM